MNEHPSDLIARTVELDAHEGGRLDLLALAGDDGKLFECEGAGLACLGQALVLDLPDGLGAPTGPGGLGAPTGSGGPTGPTGPAAPAAPTRLGAAERIVSMLGQIEAHGSLPIAGSGPIAVGALPFDLGAPASLVVPAVTFGVSRDGTAWRTTVSRRGDPEPALPGAARAPSEAPWPPDRFTLSSPCPHDKWCEKVASAVAQVESGQLAKVVLAREVLVEANRKLLVSDILGRLRALYPSCTIFSMGGFVGASPELLVSRRSSSVLSHPHAGTVARSGDPDTDDALIAELMKSPKERREHRVVVEGIASALTPLCQRLDVPEEPSIVLLRNVSHLATLIQGELGPNAPSALGLAAMLHPTPAVAGTPTGAALELIAELEGMDRDRYAGPVGWVDSRGDGDWVVGIRSATLDGTTARLVAGVGVVAGSDPREELAETQLKLQALLAAVVRP
ncbi:MAG: isochorismate synthase [Acidimicrobiales bacterium]